MAGISVLSTWAVALAGGHCGVDGSESHSWGGIGRLGGHGCQGPGCALWTLCSLCCQSCHEGLCPFLLTECPACRGPVRLGEKERHVEQECPERSLSCQHCGAACCWADVQVLRAGPGARCGLGWGAGGACWA